MTWFEAIESIAIAIVIALPVVRIWSALDRRTRAAASVRRLAGLPGMCYAFPAVIAASVFLIAVEDVVDGSHHEALLVLDRVVRDAARAAVAVPAVRRLAVGISDLTGPGLVGALLTGCVGLAIAGRRRAALVVAGGTLSAWGLSAVVKLVFRVPRPLAHVTDYAITGYGFPSAHALVTVVACGLLAWAAARGAVTGGRWVWAGVLVAAVLAAAARVLLDAHWLTDVVAGLALGTVWLSLVLLAVERAGARWSM